MSRVGRKLRTLPSVAGQVVPREGSESAVSALFRDMNTKTLRSRKATDRDAQPDEPPALKGTDISDIGDGELVAVYERDAIVTGEEYLHVRPRDCISTEDAR